MVALLFSFPYNFLYFSFCSMCWIFSLLNWNLLNYVKQFSRYALRYIITMPLPLSLFKTMLLVFDNFCIIKQYFNIILVFTSISSFSFNICQVLLRFMRDIAQKILVKQLQFCVDGIIILCVSNILSYVLFDQHNYSMC